MTATLSQTLREALVLVLICAAPPVLAALLAGVLMGLLQTATQIRESTVSTVPRSSCRRAGFSSSA